MSQEKSKRKFAIDRWNKAEESPIHQKKPRVPQVGQHHGQSTTKPPACISSHFLLFTNLYFTPPCSKHKQKPWRAFSCCHRNSYYNLKLYLMQHSSPSSTLQQLAVQREGYAARGGRGQAKESSAWDPASPQLPIISFPSVHRLFLSFLLSFHLVFCSLECLIIYIYERNFPGGAKIVQIVCDQINLVHNTFLWK